MNNSNFKPRSLKALRASALAVVATAVCTAPAWATGSAPDPTADITSITGGMTSISGVAFTTVEALVLASLVGLAFHVGRKMLNKG